MYSNKSHVYGNALAALTALVLGSSVLMGCTPQGSSGDGGSSPSGTRTSPPESSSSPSQSANTPQVGRDGRTVDPAAKAESCSLLTESEIKAELGEWAGGLQSGQGVVSTDRDGTAVDSCVYPLESGAGTDHSVVVEQRKFETAQKLADSDPFGLLMSAEPVTDFRGDAKYGMNSLTGSTEYVLVSVQDTVSTKLLVSLPSGPETPDYANVKQKLLALGKKAGL